MDINSNLRLTLRSTTVLQTGHWLKEILSPKFSTLDKNRRKTSTLKQVQNLNFEHFAGSMGVIKNLQPAIVSSK